MSLRLLIYFIILLIGTLIGIVKYKKLTMPFKWLTTMLFVTLISEAIAYVLRQKIHSANNAVYHVFNLLEYVGFAFVFYHLFINDTHKKVVKYTIFVYPILSVLLSVFVQSIWLLPSIFIIISYITLSIFCLLLFRQMMHNLSATPLFKDAIFWFNTVALIQFSTSFFSLSLTNYVIALHQYSQTINNINYGINLFFYASLCVALLLDSTTKSRYLEQL